MAANCFSYMPYLVQAQQQIKLERKRKSRQNRAQAMQEATKIDEFEVRKPFKNENSDTRKHNGSVPILKSKDVHVPIIKQSLAAASCSPKYQRQAQHMSPYLTSCSPRTKTQTS